MNIVDVKYEWSRALVKRSKTTFCVIHHEAGSGMSAEQIHQMHIKQNGWAGIGYHFYVRKDGTVYRGRPIDTVGTHTANYNANSIGVCFEGNMENENLTQAQFNSGIELLAFIIGLYPNITFKRHKDLNATACPGKNFPFELMTEGASDMAMTGAEIARKLENYFEDKYNNNDRSWADKSVQEAKNIGLTDGSRLFEPMSGYRAIALMLKAYKKGLEDSKKK